MGRTNRADKKNKKIPISGNAPTSVYTRSEDLIRYPVSIESTSRSSTVFVEGFTFVVASNHDALEAAGNEVSKCCPI